MAEYTKRRQYAQQLLDDADNVQQYADDYYRAAKRARDAIRVCALRAAGEEPFYSDQHLADLIREAETERKALDNFLRRRG